MDCVFCEIVNHRQTASIVWESNSHLAFLDIRPTSRGHALVIPKKHYRTFLDIPPAEVGVYFEAAQKVARILREVFDYKGFNLFQNNEAIAGQVVFHTHIHVVPRYGDDQIHYKRPVYTYQPNEVKEIIQQCQVLQNQPSEHILK